MIIGYARGSESERHAALSDKLHAAGCTRIYVDSSIGPRLPELDAALKRLRRGDVFVVSKLHLLGCGLNDVIQCVRLIQARGAHLRVLGDAIDTRGTAGRQTAHVLAVILNRHAGNLPALHP